MAGGYKNYIDDQRTDIRINIKGYYNAKTKSSQNSLLEKIVTVQKEVKEIVKIDEDISPSWEENWGPNNVMMKEPDLGR